MRNKELNIFYSSPNIFGLIKSERLRLVEHVASMGAMLNTNKILVGNSERKRFGILSRIWEGNI